MEPCIHLFISVKTVRLDYVRILDSASFTVMRFLPESVLSSRGSDMGIQIPF